MISVNNSISTNYIEQILVEFYNIKSKIQKLDGYEDYNFLIKSQDRKYILKISKPDFNSEYFQFQDSILEYLSIKQNLQNTPKIIHTNLGNLSGEFLDEDGHTRKVRLLSWLEGRPFSSVNPRTDELRFQLGLQCGKITDALQGFSHAFAERSFEWDTAQSLWTKKHLNLFDDEQKEIITYFQDRFEKNFKAYSKLRKQVVHNDANDNNIVVTDDKLNPEVIGLIDFGDAIHTHIINDLGICCAYAIMNFEDPLGAAMPIVKGYNKSFNLQGEELNYLYDAIAMRLVVSVSKSAIAKEKEPHNPYLTVSEKPAWDLLEKWKQISPEFAYYSFRHACGYSPHPNQEKFKSWADKQMVRIKDLIPASKSEDVYPLDLSVGSNFVGHEKEAADLDLFQFKIERLQAEHLNKVIAGGYSEPRALYSSTAYDDVGNKGRRSRTIHVGIDFWYPAKTAIKALFDGEVFTAANDSGDKEYGGLIILKHQQEDFEFFTLYAHNTADSALQHSVGDIIKKGQIIAELGNYPENGNWAPHLHFQVMLSMLHYKTDFPGVVYYEELDIWKSIVPDANLLFKNRGLIQDNLDTDKDLLKFRKKHLGKSLSLHYNEPLRIIKGSGVYLIDHTGRKYLDTVNNVAHVGHEHFGVVRAGQSQMGLLNTNTRYLHPQINIFIEELLKTLPKELSVVHLVNSGSEANEVALRMVNAATESREIIASEVGYHGNTTNTVNISSYKFNGKGGNGVPNQTHVFPLPDAYRGKYRGPECGRKYANEVKILVDKIKKARKKLGGLFLEPIISCGGQIELPEGFLADAYKIVKEAGGVCVSDEVQTGCGRMGKTFWGFQLYDVIPDIITIGKPLGNGHPVAAVVCTEAIAEKFDNGMEYFNTFGGNPVSCAIATEVLNTVKRENLQDNALRIGEYLKSELKRLSQKFPVIGDVRGQGLFLGFELVDTKLNPQPNKANYLVNRMKHFGFLMSTDGRDNNVIKIKPPMVFSRENTTELIKYLQKVLSEDYMQISS